MKGYLLGFVFLFVLFVGFTSAQQNSTNFSSVQSERVLQSCFPSYVCDEWSPCVDFLQTRACKDEQCNVRDVREVRFCQQETACQPQIICETWGECNYEEYLGNTLDGKISFGGFRSRVCRDLNNCIPNFIEESICENAYQFQLNIINECEQEFLVATNLVTKRQLAKISLASLANQRLDVVASQNEAVYCSMCYNGILDANEEKIDCGGDCKVCPVESRQLPMSAIQAVSWFLGIFFLVFLVRETRRMEQGK